MNKPVLLSILLAGASVSLAYAQDLPPLVNGAPWMVSAPNGMAVEMTFNPDGSGRVKAGILSNGVTWSLEDGAFCINGVPGDRPCMVLVAAEDAVIGTVADGSQFVFKRL